MDKNSFVELLKEFRKLVSNLAKDCDKAPGQQVQSKTLLSRLEAVSTEWFDQIEPVLRSSYGIHEDILQQYRAPFGKVLELSVGRPSKRVLVTILQSVLDHFHIDILVEVQKYQAIRLKFPGLDSILAHATGLEVDYVSEAIDCARLGKRRAAIILGWCAAVNRLHLYVEQQGFSSFNQASVQMSAIQSGRYKRFNKKFDIQNMSDLRMTVFDGDLLWVLEYLGAIDGNQHERLGICFTMRNTSAHPGDAVVSEENLLSFFSDIDNLVFADPRFSILKCTTP